MEYQAEQERMKELGMEQEDHTIDELIKDEQEAVDAYEKAIAKFEGKVEDKVIEVLKHILAEEKQHIIELEKIKNGEAEILE